MNKKSLIIGLLIVTALCAGTFSAQKIRRYMESNKTYADVSNLPTVEERKVAYRKLSNEQKAEIWKHDIYYKSISSGYENTDKGAILAALSDAIEPELFDNDFTDGSLSSEKFSNSDYGKRFQAAFGRYAQAFAPSEQRLLCGILGFQPKNVKNALSQNTVETTSGQVGAADNEISPASPPCGCSTDSSCGWCSTCLGRNNPCQVSGDGCGCFWISPCNGLCA